MKYMKVKWIHDFPDDPVLIYTEIDDDLWEHRKVELFRDGRKGFADKDEEVGGSRLGLEPWPDLEQLRLDPEFEVEEITKEQFQAVWERRKCDD